MIIVSVLQDVSDRYIDKAFSTKMLLGIGTRLLDRYVRVGVISGDRHKHVSLY